MKQDLKFGIVGAGGYWGPNWVRVLDKLGVLAAVCELEPERREALDERFGLSKRAIPILSDYAELLSLGLNSIFVVTSPETHSELAIQAIEARANVFVEKPLAESVENALKIKDRAQQAGKIVMVGHTFVYHPAVQAFKRHLNEVGKIRSINTVRANFGVYQQCGILNDLLPHDLSIFHYLLGNESVMSDIQSLVIPTQEMAFVCMNYGEVACSSYLSWGYPDKTRKLVALGSQGILEWDLDLKHLLFHRKTVEKLDNGRFTHQDEGTRIIQILDQSEALLNEALHFIECIQEGKEPLTGIDEGIIVIKGLEACR